MHFFLKINGEHTLQGIVEYAQGINQPSVKFALNEQKGLSLKYLE